MQIIQRCLNRYITNRRKKRRDLLMRYYNFCAEQIVKSIRGYIVKKQYSPILQRTRNAKIIIERFLQSFKVRLILRTKVIQNLLNHIAHMKYLLINLHCDNRISEKSEKLKFELIDKLPKALSNFYLEYYKLRKRNLWVKAPRIKDLWINDYIRALKNNNTLIDNRIIHMFLYNDSQEKFKFDDKKVYKDTIDIDDVEEFKENPICKKEKKYFKEIDNQRLKTNSETNREKSPFMSREEFYSNDFSWKNNFNPLSNPNNSKVQNLENFDFFANRENQSINHHREISNISFLNNSHANNFYNNLNESNPNIVMQSSKNLKFQKLISKDAENNHDGITNENINNPIKKGMGTSSENFYDTIPNSHQTNANIQQNFNSSNRNFYVNAHNLNFATNISKPKNPYDDRPIKANPNIFNEIILEKESHETNKEILTTEEYGQGGDKKIKPKASAIRKKTPKYDARRAIENAKSKDKNLVNKLHNDKEKYINQENKEIPNENNILIVGKNNPNKNKHKDSGKNNDFQNSKVNITNDIADKFECNISQDLEKNIVIDKNLIKMKTTSNKIVNANKKDNPRKLANQTHENISNLSEAKLLSKDNSKHVLNSKKVVEQDNRAERDNRHGNHEVYTENPKDTFDNSTKETKKRKIDVSTNRRRLIEMEKSPHPRVDITKIKSKIDCWGGKNTSQEFNINANKFRRMDNFLSEEIRCADGFEEKKTQYANPKKNYNSLNVSSPTYNLSNLKENCDSSLKNISNIDIEFNYLSELENKYNKINNFSRIRNEELKFSKIPFIKENSFYIKHYSDDIYDVNFF